jgi:aryl-alcohol dehydrogenase-like predicted oxidoreductase/enamine deaminase RidA (YjgF/YER057c/UK114 family)
MNLNFPPVIIGLWQIADIERKNRSFDPASVVQHMEAYLDAGLHFFDMADHYGSAEIIAGLLYRKRKEEGKTLPLMATKWVPKPGRQSRTTAKDAVLRALKRLQVEAIDLLQFHAWDYTDPSWVETLFYLEELRKDGCIHSLGVTNMDTVHLKMAIDSGMPIASNQISHSLLDQRAQKEMIPYCEKNNIQLLCYGTVAGGLISDKWLGKPEPSVEEQSTWSLMKYKRFQEVVGSWPEFQSLLETLNRISKKLNISIAQLAALFIKEESNRNSVIIGARLGEREYIQDHKQLCISRLDEASKEELLTLIRTFHPIHGDCGDEYRYPPFLTASGDLSHHFASFPPAFEVKNEGNGRLSASSGTIWESFAGYSRVVKKGNHLFVSGTTATQGNFVVGGKSPESQMHFVIDKMEGALRSMNASLKDVVRTRVYVSNAEHWEAIARVHGKRFAEIKPANTLIIAKLIGDEYLVEVEMDALIDD